MAVPTYDELIELRAPMIGWSKRCVDGERLAELMIDHEVGVTLRPLRVPKLDSDYFEE